MSCGNLRWTQNQDIVGLYFIESYNKFFKFNFKLNILIKL